MSMAPCASGPTVVDAWRAVHRALVSHRHHGDRVGQALGGEAGAVDRVYGDVDLVTTAAAESLADREAGGLVFFALGGHDHPVDVDRPESGPDRVDSGLVSSLLLASPHPSRGAKGRGHCRAHEVQSETGLQEMLGHRFPPCL